jgi:hypothetical protein
VVKHCKRHRNGKQRNIRCLEYKHLRVKGATRFATAYQPPDRDYSGTVDGG